MMDPVSEWTLELRLSRFVGNGFHEDVDLTNFTQERTQFRLELEVEADFADLVETTRERKQNGTLNQEWRQAGDGQWELAFDYRAENSFDVQGNRGTVYLHRGVILRIGPAASAPAFANGVIGFDVNLGPLASWHACIEVIAMIEGETLPVQYGCRSFETTNAEFDRRRETFLCEATGFTAPGSHTLTPVVLGTLEQAKRDLAALRLYDLDKSERAWVTAAGLPIYIATFGRDALTAAWQAGLISADLMKGTLAELARLQGEERNDWRDEMPGRMLHEAHTGPLAMLQHNPRRCYYGSVTTSGFYAAAVSELWHWTGSKELVRPFIAPALAALRSLDEDCARFD